MGSRTVLEAIGDFTVLSAIIPLGIFIVLYYFRSPWHSTLLGRSLMIQKVDLFLLLTFIVASLFIPDFFGREYVRLGLYLLMVGTLWNDVVQLFRIQQQDRRASKRELRFWQKIKRPTR